MAIHEDNAYLGQVHERFCCIECKQRVGHAEKSQEETIRRNGRHRTPRGGGWLINAVKDEATGQKICDTLGHHKSKIEGHDNGGVEVGHRGESTRRDVTGIHFGAGKRPRSLKAGRGSGCILVSIPLASNNQNSHEEPYIIIALPVSLRSTRHAAASHRGAGTSKTLLE